MGCTSTYDARAKSQQRPSMDVVVSDGKPYRASGQATRIGIPAQAQRFRTGIRAVRAVSAGNRLPCGSASHTARNPSQDVELSDGIPSRVGHSDGNPSRAGCFGWEWLPCGGVARTAADLVRRRHTERYLVQNRRSPPARSDFSSERASRQSHGRGPHANLSHSKPCK